MSSQSPVFVLGPTDIFERLRHTVNVATIDYRSASFGEMLTATGTRSAAAAAQEYDRDTASALSEAV